MQGLCAISSIFSQENRAIFTMKMLKKCLTKQHIFSILSRSREEKRQREGEGRFRPPAKKGSSHRFRCGHEKRGASCCRVSLLCALPKEKEENNGKVGFSLDIFSLFGYNKKRYRSAVYGAVMVSTGILRYDKRSGQEDPVKPSDLNNKRQQQSCCSGVSRVAAICRPYRRRGLRLRPCVK